MTKVLSGNLTERRSTSTYNPYIDIAKFVMSILVVMIHVHPCEGILGFILYNIIARVADPMFFIITSYFFFRNMKNKAEDEETYLLNYLKRIAILYAIAIAVNSLKIYKSFLRTTPGFLNRALWIIRKFLFEGPYMQLWFLTALFTAIPLTWYLGKRIGKKATLAVSFAFYLPVIAYETYTALVFDWAPFKIFAAFFLTVFGEYGGLTFGFFFCSIGMVLALGDDTHENSFPRDCICLFISFAALFAEAFTLRRYKIPADYCSMFFLIPVCHFLQKVLLEAPGKEMSESTVEKTKFLRHMSIIIYIFHMFFKDVYDYLLKDSYSWYHKYSFIRFMMVLVTSLVFAAAVVKLSRYPKFRFLKYLY